MSDKKPYKSYWVPAKKYGYGWGFPQTWQGALVLIAYLVLMTVLCFASINSIGLLILGSSLLSIGMLILCYMKGEPPKWRKNGEPVEWFWQKKK